MRIRSKLLDKVTLGTSINFIIGNFGDDHDFTEVTVITVMKTLMSDYELDRSHELVVANHTN